MTRRLPASTSVAGVACGSCRPIPRRELEISTRSGGSSVASTPSIDTVKAGSTAAPTTVSPPGEGAGWEHGASPPRASSSGNTPRRTAKGSPPRQQSSRSNGKSHTATRVWTAKSRAACAVCVACDCHASAASVSASVSASASASAASAASAAALLRGAAARGAGAVAARCSASSACEIRMERAMAAGKHR
eukprot:scaffold86484_cov54-Phaeocystis_antarctica.AAC.3